MTDRQKSNKEHFQNWCESMDFAGMREPMMSQREELCGCGCLEMINKVMPKSSWPQNPEKQSTE